MIELRSKIWSKDGLESEGTYAVTAEITSLLRFILELAPQERFRNTLNNKLTTFLKSDHETWNLEESDVLFNLLQGGAFASLMTGSKALYKETACCIILGFSDDVKSEDGLKSLDLEKLSSFRSNVYCSDPKKEKALVVFVGDHHYLPEVRAVDVTDLIPVDTLPSETAHDKPHSSCPLYDKEIIQNLLKVLSIDTDETTSLVIRQSQVYIIKAISH